MRRRGASIADIERAYRERFHVFVRAATAIVQDADAARDVVQDGFAIALRRRRAFRGDGDLEAWLWRIVLNVARDAWRSGRPRVASVARVETATSDNEPIDELRNSILALPERQRIAIFLRYYGDLSYDQIAEALEISAGTVAASLHAAHQTLRRQLEEVRQ